MQRTFNPTRTVTAVLLAASMFGGVAHAGDPAAKTKPAADTQNQVQPAAGGAPMQPSTGADATVRDLDTNTQRQHSAQKPAGADARAQTQGGGTMAAAGGSTRSWGEIDTDKDNLISPAEMEKALQEKGPQSKK